MTCIHANETSTGACTCDAACECRIPQGGKCPPVSDVERPEKFEPFEKWKAAWKPYPLYVTLTEAAKRIEEAGESLSILSECQVIGQTMHVERELPSDVWSSGDWVVDVAGNSVGKPVHAEHLHFQVQVFEADLEVALGVRAAPEPRERGPAEPGVLNVPGVEVVAHPGVPQGWVLQTVEGVAWQAEGPDGTYGPLRPEIGLAVGDAWSKHTQRVWLLQSPDATNTDPDGTPGDEPGVRRS